MAGKTVSAGYISSFSMELYLMIQAGIPLGEGMDILKEGEADSHLRELLGNMAETLHQGYPLQTALAQVGIFPQYMVDMIGVGEQTGRLDQGLKGLSDYYDRQEQLSQTLRRAVLYPAVLLCVLILVMGVLIIEVLPMFNDVYTQLGATMTGVAAGILAFGMFIKSHWVATIILFVAVVALAVVWALRGQKKGERVLLSKRLALAVASARVASVLSMALHSGMDMDMAMDLAENLTQHPEVKGNIKTCRTAMADGAPFADALTQAGLFSSLYCRMLGVGVRTGTIDQVMEDIAQRSDRSAQDAIESYIGGVEPTLVVIMSVLVGIVLMSVMLPLASIMSSLG